MIKLTIFLSIVLSISACTQSTDTICTQISSNDLARDIQLPISKVLPEYKKSTYVQCGHVAMMFAKSNTGYFLTVHNGDDVIMHEDSIYSITINPSQSTDNSVRLRSNGTNLKYDHISYTFLGANGDPIGTAVDFTRDGNIDMKIFNNLDKTLIFINNEWNELIEHNKKDSVIIDGSPANVKVTGGKWVTY